MFEGAGLAVHDYPYYDGASGGLAFEAMCQALRGLPAKSVVLLHACCHNPTGVDLTPAQWDALVPILVEGGLVPYLDLAYQGFGDGIVEDAYALRALAAARDGAGRPLSFFVANSFSKSMSLYGERCGALSVVCADAGEATNVLGQLKFTVRRNYSSPPIHGGQIVAAVLTEPALRRDWEAELAAMRERIQAMRRSLHGVLAAKVPDRDFGYFLSQRGMFSYTGLSPRQVDRLREEFAVYLVRSGRMCVAGLNRGNVEATRRRWRRRPRRLTRAASAPGAAGEAPLREQRQAGGDAGEAVAADQARRRKGAAQPLAQDVEPGRAAGEVERVDAAGARPACATVVSRRGDDAVEVGVEARATRRPRRARSRAPPRRGRGRSSRGRRRRPRSWRSRRARPGRGRSARSRPSSGAGAAPGRRRTSACRAARRRAAGCRRC